MQYNTEQAAKAVLTGARGQCRKNKVTILLQLLVSLSNLSQSRKKACKVYRITSLLPPVQVHSLFLSNLIGVKNSYSSIILYGEKIVGLINTPHQPCSQDLVRCLLQDKADTCSHKSFTTSLDICHSTGGIISSSSTATQTYSLIEPVTVLMSVLHLQSYL